MVKGITALLGGAVLAGVALFTFFGAYWAEVLLGDDSNEEDK